MNNLRRYLHPLILLCVFSVISCDQIVTILGTAEARSPVNPFVERGVYPDGQLKYEFQLDSAKKRHGEGKQYYESGKIKSAFKYDHGEKIWAASYFKSGSIAMEIPYKDNKKEGLRRKYFENGQLESEMPYRKDQIGKGLKEFTKSGKLKKDYPALIVDAIDKTAVNGTYEIEVYFDKNPQRGTYYVGKLEDGFLHFDLVELDKKDKKGVLEYRVPPGFYVMEKLYFIGEYKTPMGNTFITEKSFNLSIENQD